MCMCAGRSTHCLWVLAAPKRAGGCCPCFAETKPQAGKIKVSTRPMLEGAKCETGAFLGKSSGCASIEDKRPHWRRMSHTVKRILKSTASYDRTECLLPTSSLQKVVTAQMLHPGKKTA